MHTTYHKEDGAQGRHPFLAQGDFVYRQGEVPVFTAAEGVVLIDAEGHRYLDAEAANGAAILGYDNGLIPNALRALGALPAAPSFCESGIRLRLASRLAGMIQAKTGLSGRVAFDLGGAQGIELAIKIARCTRPRGRLVVFEGAYHGRSHLTAQLSASQRYRRHSALTVAVERLPLPDCRRCRFQRSPESCSVECATYVRSRFDAEYGGVFDPDEPDVAAFLFEPMLNVAGLALPDVRYLQACIAQVRRMGGLIIADEVFAGMFRTGPLFGFQRYGIEPDIIVFSKGLTNAITPLSCVWAREPLAAPDVFPPGTHSATYINNPLAFAIATAVLDRIESQDVEALVSRLEGELAQGCLELRDLPRVLSANACGATARVQLKERNSSAVKGVALKLGSQVVCGFDGLLVASTGMTDDVVALHPPFTSSTDEVAAMFMMLRAAIRSV